MQLWPTRIHYICFCFLFVTIIAAWVMPPRVLETPLRLGQLYMPSVSNINRPKTFPLSRTKQRNSCKEIKSNFLYLNCKGLPCSGEKGNTQERNAYGTKQGPAQRNPRVSQLPKGGWENPEPECICYLNPGQKCGFWLNEDLDPHFFSVVELCSF